MEGAVKEWVGSFGFIEVSGEPDIFVHRAACPNYERLKPGDRVRFTIGKSRDGRRAALAVELIEPAAGPRKYTGIVKALLDNYGFVSMENPQRDVYFNFANVEAADLAVGDIVEFIIDLRPRLQAKQIVVLQEA